MSMTHAMASNEHSLESVLNHNVIPRVSKTLSGQLIFQYILNTTQCTCMYAKYPLKLLRPTQASIHNSSQVVLISMLGYGGGMVSGDAININVHLKAQTQVMLVTPASTKIYKQLDARVCVQNLHVTLDHQAVFAWLPDPVTCYRGSAIVQRTSVQLTSEKADDDHHHVLLVDWMTCGRKRLRESQEETDESWTLQQYDSTIDIGNLENPDKPLVYDRIRLEDTEMFTLRERMHDMHVLGTLVVMGSKFKAVMELLEKDARRQTFREEEACPSGNADKVGARFANVWFSVSALENTKGMIMRFCGRDTESVYDMLRTVLSPAESILGYSIYPIHR